MKQTDAAVISSKPRDILRRCELKEVIDLQNRVEVLVFGIRQQLDAGASLEPGQLGASTLNLCTFDELAKAGIGDATEIDGYGTLNIPPADDIKRVREKWPKLAHEMWVF
jgi:hypothetical protein